MLVTYFDALEGATEEEGVTTGESAHWVLVSVERDVDFQIVDVPHFDGHIV